MLIPDSQLRVPLPSIVPGEVVTMTDHGQAEPYLLAVQCFGDDSGGDVYHFPDDGSPSTPQIRLVDPENFSRNSLVAAIGRGGRYERDIITKTHHAARLIFTHTVKP